MKQRLFRRFIRWSVVAAVVYVASDDLASTFPLGELSPEESAIAELSYRLHHAQAPAKSFQYLTAQAATPDPTLLATSVLSILKTYYVDSQRLSSRELLDRGLYELTADRRYRLDTVESDVFLLSSPSESIKLKIPDEYTTSMLVEHCLAIASFVDKTENSSDGLTRLLNSMLHSLDPHSMIMTADQYSDLRQGTEGSFGGLGVVVGIQDDLLTVIKAIPHSPAERAGIIEHDQIMSVNTVSTFGSTLNDLVQHMRGAPGSLVKLKILRQGLASPLELTLRRELIEVEAAEGDLIEKDSKNILQIKVESFSSRTARDILEIVRKYSTRKGSLDGIVLDLRSNPGGLLDQAVQVADLFLASGDIVSTIGRRKELERAYHDLKDINLPMAVLINEKTASASEIVAGALQDNNRAVIIGQPSYGKGSVQTVFELDGGEALKLTIARYYTPSGKSIQSVGIQPDVWLQPVEPSDKNINLFGEDRYRSERFSNLKFRKSDRNLKDPSDTVRFKGYKGFYLKNKSKDTELDFASSLILAKTQSSDDRITGEFNRASYILASRHKFIKQYMKSHFREVSSWLYKNHHISWGSSANKAYQLPGVEMKISLSDQDQVTAGDTLKVKWVLANSSSRSFSQLSFFISPSIGALDSREVLIGDLAANEEKSGMVDLPVKFVSDHEFFDLKLGVAVGGWALSALTKEVRINVIERRQPEIEYFTRVVESDPRRGYVEVKLVNASSIPARDTVVAIKNLSGHQISIPKSQSKPLKLGPYESRIFRFPYEATKSELGKSLHFGFTMDSRDLVVPKKDSIDFKVKQYKQASNNLVRVKQDN